MTINLTELKILAIDCQTTGANPDKGLLLEIGWIPGRASLPIKSAMPGLRSYLIGLPPETAIPRAVQRITGITEASMKTAAPSEIVWNYLIQTVKNVGFNLFFTRIIAFIQGHDHSGDSRSYPGILILFNPECRSNRQVFPRKFNPCSPGKPVFIQVISGGCGFINGMAANAPWSPGSMATTAGYTIMSIPFCAYH